MTINLRAPALLPTLPGRAYSDPEFFALEQERLFARSWSAVALAADVAPGSFVEVELAGESVLVLRDHSGSVRSFFNVCRHRGSRLCTETAGALERFIRCPYHAWTYGLDGRLIAGPGIKSMEAADLEGFGLEPVATHVWQGQIWCCLDPRPPSFDASVVVQAERRLGSLAVLDRYGLDELVLASRRTYEIAANWKLLIENFMECYHCATIHPELTNTLPEFRTGVGTQNQPGSSAAFADTVEAFTLSGRGGLGLLPGLSGDDDRRYYGMTLLPQVFFNLLPDHVVVHRMRPVAVDRSVIVCDWLVERGQPASPGFAPHDTIALFDRVNLQDFVACERCQKNMSSRRYAGGGVLAATEHHLAVFHSYVLDAVGATRASLT